MLSQDADVPAAARHVERVGPAVAGEDAGQVGPAAEVRVVGDMDLVDRGVGGNQRRCRRRADRPTRLRDAPCGERTACVGCAAAVAPYLRGGAGDGPGRSQQRLPATDPLTAAAPPSGAVPGDRRPAPMRTRRTA